MYIKLVPTVPVLDRMKKKGGGKGREKVRACKKTER